MGCCGDKRKAAVSRLGNVLLFEYVGRTGLTVTGPISRRTYRFPLQGARVAVDARDAAALGAIPTLRRVPPGDASPHGVESATG